MKPRIVEMSGRQVLGRGGQAKNCAEIACFEASDFAGVTLDPFGRADCFKTSHYIASITGLVAKPAQHAMIPLHLPEFYRHENSRQ
jgi:hypothetical protein